MNAVQKRKAKKIAYRAEMRKKINFISKTSLDYAYRLDSIEGFDNKGRCYSHLTNFDRWQLKTYRMALETYRGNHGQFGLSDTTIITNYEEGWTRDAPHAGALFVSGPWTDLSDFWEHLRRVEDELTRYTRRERQRNPMLRNNSEFRTFRRPRA